VLAHVPLGDPRLDRFQQAVAAELSRLERLIAAIEIPAPGFDFIEAKALDANGLATFTGLRGDARDTLGYVLKVDLDSNGTGSVQYALRVNEDAGASAYRYAYATLGNGGALATGAGDDTADSILLGGATATNRFCGTISIPGSRSGLDRLVQGEFGETNGSTVRGSIVRGSWVNTTDEITKLSLTALTAGPVGTVSLYRTLR
jgi:hypothetical protein